MDLVDIMALEHSHRVSCMTEPHIHSEVEINFVLAGSMTYFFNGEQMELSPGQLVIFWGAVPHRVVETSADARFGCMYLPIERFLGLPVAPVFVSAVLGGQMVMATKTDALDPPLFVRWHQDVRGRQPQRVGIAQDEVASRIRRMDADGWRQLGLQAGKPRAGKSETGGRLGRMAKAQRMACYIVEHLSEPLSVATIAKAIGLHPNYAMALFRQCLGLTITQYISRRRRAVAQALLVSTDQDVTQIAFAAGFGSLSRFYEVFRAEFGMTPKAYRNLHQLRG